MELTLYDTLTREKRPFAPIDPTNVRMYVCGPTVYDFAHIGNARPVIVFDVLYRLLRHLYGPEHVTFVRNITDVDDKINARAATEHPGLPLNEAIRRVTEQTERQFHEDVKALGCLVPDVEPRATEHIAEMKALIERLVAQGVAYVAEEHVLFHVPAMPDYGRLARRSLDEMVAGARVEVAPFKRDPTDFVLWKPSKPGEPAWPSPAGIATPGRPGWHIECSAMSWKHLGETFDIHGGGIDLVFPHHENEIAQSRCAFHTKAMANYWLHNGFLQVEGEKMSKSLGNFVTINELLRTDAFGGRRWPGEVLRLTMLMTHYRQPVDWTVSALTEAQTVLADWKRLIAQVDVREVQIEPEAQVAEALLDDLNTPEAIGFIHQLAKVAQKDAAVRPVLYANLVFLGLLPDQRALAQAIHYRTAKELQLPEQLNEEALNAYRPKLLSAFEESFLQLLPSANVTGTIATTSWSFGIDPSSVPIFNEWAKYNPGYISSDDRRHIDSVIGIKKLNRLIETRLQARAAKDFKESDRIRDELAASGIALKDSKDGTTWEVAR
jgi:cysteinyl-tRNA synthetase